MKPLEKIRATFMHYSPFFSLYFQVNPLPGNFDASSRVAMFKSLENFKPLWNEHTVQCLQFLNLTGQGDFSRHIMEHKFQGKTLPATTAKELFPKFLHFHLLLELADFDFKKKDNPEIEEWLQRVKKLPSIVDVFQILKLSYNLQEDEHENIAKAIDKDHNLIQALEEISTLME